MPDDRPKITPVKPPTEIENDPTFDLADKPRTPAFKKLQSQLEDFYNTIGITVIAPFDKLAGALVLKQSEALADSWIDLAEKDPRIKRAIEKVLSAGSISGVVAAHAMVLMPVLANRGYLPDMAAEGAVGLTLMQYPELAPYFTHPRFSGAAETNGNGNSQGI